MATRRKRPYGFRLAAKAIYTADQIRREHGDENIASLLCDLATQLQDEKRSRIEHQSIAEMAEAHGRHDHGIALNALIEIRDMADKSVRGAGLLSEVEEISAKCRRVIKILGYDPDVPLRQRPASVTP